MVYIQFKFFVSLRGKVDSTTYNSINRIFRFLCLYPKQKSFATATELDTITISSVIDKEKFYVLKDFRFAINKESRTFKSSYKLNKVRYNIEFISGNDNAISNFPIFRLVSEELNP